MYQKNQEEQSLIFKSEVKIRKAEVRIVDYWLRKRLP